MQYDRNDLEQLVRRLAELKEKQDALQREIDRLDGDLHLLKTQSVTQPETESTIAVSHEEPHIDEAPLAVASVADTPPEVQPRWQVPPHRTQKVRPPKPPSDFEKFIGENLANKIGILILVIGAGIGVKYAIDHELISLLTRVILGYLLGAGLLAIALRLKAQYKNFSAVLLSGAMAIAYFMTYAAHAFYGFIPVVAAFGIMALITVATVYAALWYDTQVIALIGLAGAYGVPFILDSMTGSATVFFAYIALINCGILVIAFRKYWKALYYVAFLLTWTIYFLWFSFDYRVARHFNEAVLFLFLFFLIFYITLLAYKVRRREEFVFSDTVLLLANAFIFYGIGFALLNDRTATAEYLGLFTLGNAVLHGLAGILIMRQQLPDQRLFYLVAGLVLVFVAIAVPVQLDGNWVTFLWAGLALLTFWIGSTKKMPPYQGLSYVLIALAMISLWDDWTDGYYGVLYGMEGESLKPLLNINFLTSLFFIACVSAMTWLIHRTTDEAQGKLSKFGAWFLPALLVFAVYQAFRFEVAAYCDQIYRAYAAQSYAVDSWFDTGGRLDAISRLGRIWEILYSLAFVTALLWVSGRLWKSKTLGAFALVFTGIALLVYCALGLYDLHEMHATYTNARGGADANSPLPAPTAFYIGIRYLSYGFVVVSIWVVSGYVKREIMSAPMRNVMEITMHGIFLWIVSMELVNWTDVALAAQSTKLGMSILWGLYAVLLIVLGISMGKRHLRITAIILFAVVLFKLLLYDIRQLDTLSRTIVLITLGILLLVVSFLYNKYKKVIFGPDES